MSSLYITEPPTRGKVLITTTRGEIEVELWPRECPTACRNFVQLCLEGYYIETIFHRVIPNFIIQGGDPSGTGTGGQSIYDDPFKDEFHQRLKYNRRGLLGMANNGTNDNGSQFFITLDAAPELQNRNTLFGRVAGDTIYNVMKIGAAEIQEGTERPLYPAKVTKIEVITNPFDDIVPRTTPEEVKRRQALQQVSHAPVVKKPAKNKKLLSFVDDGEEAEPVVFKSKVKSSYDITVGDSRPPTQSTSKATSRKRKITADGGLRSPEVGQAKSTLNFETSTFEARIASRSPTPEKEPATNQMDTVQAQIDALTASLKRRPANVVPAKQEKGLSYIDEQRLKYKSKALIGSRKKTRHGFTEDDVLAKLSQFQSKLTRASSEVDVSRLRRPEAQDADEHKCRLHNVPNCQSCAAATAAATAKESTAEAALGTVDFDDDGRSTLVDVADDSWLTHTLVFPADHLGKDLTDREKRDREARMEAHDGGLEVIDPREKAGRLRLEAREARRVRDEKSGRNQHLRPDRHGREERDSHRVRGVGDRDLARQQTSGERAGPGVHDERGEPAEVARDCTRPPSPKGNGVDADRWR